MDDEIYDRIIYLADPELSEPVLVVSLKDGSTRDWVRDGHLDHAQHDKHRGPRDL